MRGFHSFSVNFELYVNLQYFHSFLSWHPAGWMKMTTEAFYFENHRFGVVFADLPSQSSAGGMGGSNSILFSSANF